MNVLIITLLIANVVVTIGTATVIGSKINELNSNIEALRAIEEMNSVDICSTKTAIVETVNEVRDKVLVSNESTRDSLKGILIDEVPKGLFRFMYPAVKRNVE